jgi:putative NADH-flavin reductase
MKITVFGAAGNVGTRVINEALSRGHEVTAVVRSASRINQLNPLVKAVLGDASKVEDVVRLSEGQDLLVSATRPAKGSESDLIAITKSLLAGLAQTGVRLLLVGGAASLTVPNSNGTLVVNDPNFVGPGWLDIALACLEQYKVCAADNQVDWSYLSPPALILPGQRTAKFRLGNDELILDQQGKSTISLEDFAVALIDEAEQPKQQRRRFTVAY